MKPFLFSFSTFCIINVTSTSSNMIQEDAANEEIFQEKLNEGRQLLGNEPDAENTKILIQKLHNMKAVIDDELKLTPQQSEELEEKMKDYVQVQKDHINEMGDSIDEINHHSHTDVALYQGDMILSKLQADEIIEEIEATKENRTRRQAVNADLYRNSKWPNNQVYYSFDPSASPAAKRVFEKAVKKWEEVTCLRFFHSDTENDRIVVISDGGCWSYVGHSGGQQKLSLGPGCESVGTAAHELAHALGFYHMQSRSDRDNYITLQSQNFAASHFKLNRLADVVIKYIDYRVTGKLNLQSKMRKLIITTAYRTITEVLCIMDQQEVKRSVYVSRNGLPVMVTKDLDYMQTLGSPFISFYETLMMNKHYGCNQCSHISKTYCANDGFPNPNNCNRCICPSGYGGLLCDRKPGNCGGELKAEYGVKQLIDIVGDKNTYRTTEDFRMCYYWIKAPPGQKIQVRLDGYESGVSTDGCRHTGVEIKTGKDKRHTGYRFCSPDNIGKTLTSFYHIVPVVTYSDGWEVKTILSYWIASSDTRNSGRQLKTTTTNSRNGTITARPPPPTKTRCEDSPICKALLRSTPCKVNKNQTVKEKLCPRSCGMCRP
ncbi:astacin [Dictyocaulus viviparus]|uniref:Zinc metalloproteinase n=1 Tax=Dictyocaulus viviparus TaxID=29172 RepID=A0A0D8X8R4_DICVI|nr:astacin [Dictyocaulus viviparus]